MIVNESWDDLLASGVTESTSEETPSYLQNVRAIGQGSFQAVKESSYDIWASIARLKDNVSNYSLLWGFEGLWKSVYWTLSSVQNAFTGTPEASKINEAVNSALATKSYVWNEVSKLWIWTQLSNIWLSGYGAVTSSLWVLASPVIAAGATAAPETFQKIWETYMWAEESTVSGLQGTGLSESARKNALWLWVDIWLAGTPILLWTILKPLKYLRNVKWIAQAAELGAKLWETQAFQSAVSLWKRVGETATKAWDVLSDLNKSIWEALTPNFARLTPEEKFLKYLDWVKDFAETNWRAPNNVEIQNIAKETLGRKLDDTLHVNLNAVTWEPPVANKTLIQSVEEAVWNKQTITKANRKAIIASIAEEHWAEPKQVWTLLENTIQRNRDIANTWRNENFDVKQSVEVIRAKSLLWATWDDFDRAYKFDSSIPDSVATLEANWYLTRVNDKVRDDLYSFQITDKFRKSKLLSNDEIRKIDQSGWYTHVPKDVYEKAYSDFNAKWTTKPFEEVSREQISKAIEKPETIWERLTVIDEAKWNVKKLERTTTDQSIYKRIRKAYPTIVDKISPGVKSDIEWLAKKYRIELPTFADAKWNITNLSALDEAMRTLWTLNLDNFTILPIPKTLKSSLRRDEIVSNMGFKEGVKVTKEARKNTVDAFNSMLDNIRNKTSPYQFYGTKKEIDQIKGQFAARLEKVNTEKQFREMMEQVAANLERMNKNILDAQITAELKKFIRPETPWTVSKKPLTPEERMALEATATWYAEYRKTANAENLKLVLDTIRLTEEMWRERYKNIKLQTVAQLRKDVETIREEWIRSINEKEADTLYWKLKQMWKTAHYTFISSNRQRLSALEGWMDKLLFKKWYELDTARHNVDNVRDVFMKNYADTLKWTKWEWMAAQERLGQYMFMQQEDFLKYVLDEDGTFVNPNVFEWHTFNSLGELMEYKKALEQEVRESKPAMIVTENVRRMIDDNLKKARMVDLAYDWAMRWEVKNYYSASKAEWFFKLPELGEDIFQSRKNTIDKTASYSRKYRGANGEPISFRPHLATDTGRFINRNVRYAEVRPAYEAYKSLLEWTNGNNGALAGLNRFTQNAFKQALVDASAPDISPFSTINAIMWQLSVSKLSYNLSPVFKQYLSLADALVYVPVEDMEFGFSKWVSGVFWGNKLIESAKEHSVALRRSFGLDSSLDDIQAYSNGSWIFNKWLKNFNKVWMWALTESDALNKFSIFAGAYYKKMKELYPSAEHSVIQSYILDRGFTDEDAVRYADEVMQNVASSKDKWRVPVALRWTNPLTNVIGKAIFALQSSNISRYGLATVDLPLMWKIDRARAIKGAIGMATASTLEVLTGPATKVMEQAVRNVTGLWTQDNEYEDLFLDNLFWKDSNGDRQWLVNLIFYSFLKNLPVGSNLSWMNYSDSYWNQQTSIVILDEFKRLLSAGSDIADNIEEEEYFNALLIMLNEAGNVTSTKLTKAAQDITDSTPAFNQFK